MHRVEYYPINIVKKTINIVIIKTAIVIFLKKKKQL